VSLFRLQRRNRGSGRILRESDRGGKSITPTRDSDDISVARISVVQCAPQCRDVDREIGGIHMSAGQTRAISSADMATPEV